MMPIAIMLMDEGDDSNANKSDVVGVIEIPFWEMKQCTIIMLKKAVYNVGWEATLVLVLRWRIKKKAWQIPLPTILCLFNTVKERLAVCA